MPTPSIEESTKFIKNNELFFKMMFDLRAEEWRRTKTTFQSSSLKALNDALAEEITNWRKGIYFPALKSSKVREELENIKRSSIFQSWRQLSPSDTLTLKIDLSIYHNEATTLAVKKNLIHFDKFLEQALTTVWSLQKKKHRHAKDAYLLYTTLYSYRNLYVEDKISLDDFKRGWKETVNSHQNPKLNSKEYQILLNALEDAPEQIQGIEHARIDAGDENLSKAEMQLLKNSLNAKKTIPEPTVSYAYFFNDRDLHQPPVLTDDNREIFIPEQDSKLSPQFDSKKNPMGIKVNVINHNGKTLVKVGPCDLSGIGRHLKRKEFIKNLVNDALQQADIKKTYEEVNVSACVGVRGRWQMFTGFFKNNETIQKEQGRHMNAYIKTAGESDLELWEPREGPQGFFNDTICGMVIAVGTNLFEHHVMTKETYSSKQATQDILKNKAFKKIFDKVLSITRNKIAELVSSYQKIIDGNSMGPK